MAAVRAGSHPGFDRFVIEFGGALPSWTVAVQPAATVTSSPKGDMVTLQGTGGVLVTIQPVSGWTSYAGPTQVPAGLTYLREARLVENFEGVQQWALGIQGAPCVLLSTLASPSRLVVDVYGR